MKQTNDFVTSHLPTYSLAISVGALYVRKYFREDSKAAALEMVNNIRYQFENILKEVNWMDNETRKSALNKLHSMSTHIGYPDEIMDNAKIEEYYKDLEIDANDYLKSVLHMNVFGTDYAFNKLRKPVNKTDWVTHARPAIVNAFYSSIENSIRKLRSISIRKFPLLAHFYSISPIIANFYSLILTFTHLYPHRIPSWYFTRTFLLSRSAKIFELWCHWFCYRS